MRGPLVVSISLIALATCAAQIVGASIQGRAGAPVLRTADSDPPPALRDLLDAYWKNEFDVVQRVFETGADVAAIVPTVRAWVASTAARGWREGALVLVLDLADAALRLPRPDRQAASQLIALGYSEITRRPERDKAEDDLDRRFETRWHEAAVAVLLGAQDSRAVADYTNKLEQRYETGLPARFWLARGVALERRGMPDQIVAAFDRAARDPVLRAEASARAAAVFNRVQRYRDALRRLDIAGDPGNDLAVAAMLPYLRGGALAGLREYAQALTALDEATALAPESDDVREARNETLRALGQKAEEHRARTSDRQEPWDAIGQGDYRFVPRWLAELKAGLRTSTSNAADDRPPIFDMFDRYEAGDYGQVVDTLVKSVSLESLSLDLRNSADAWITSGPAAALAHREMVVAALALEAAQARGYLEWPRAQLIVEWACERLRARPTPTDGERAWMYAAAVLMEGVVQGAALEVHAAHALKRFPDDPALTMARAVAVEVRAGPDFRSRDGLESPSSNTLELLVYRLKQAAVNPAFRDEAQLRLGYTALRQRKYKDTL
ncbi:MAG TPA: hypothetical protein VFO19_04765, partial [Vicinamibacterales bacterium]|nr:hypothetical protein [Vicinamibacterales bacterium]